MAKNPMQRKAQNSFLLGMFITLLITGIVIALLVLQLTKVTEEKKALQKNMTNAYVLANDIKSGETITADKLIPKAVDSNSVPKNAITPNDITTLSQVTSEDGKLVREVNVVAKIDLGAGTVVTSDMIMQEGEISKDTRIMEYNMIALPSQLATGKYIDIRLRLPNGLNYIVVSHKKVTLPEVGGVESSNTISINMDEAEILTMSGAIVEAYKIEGAMLQAVEYVEPGFQGAATATYVPSNDTLALITRDPNCVGIATNALYERLYVKDEEGNYTTMKPEATDSRDKINSALNENAESGAESVISGLEEEVKKMQEERQKYLDSMSGGY